MSKYSRKDYQGIARLIANLDPVSRDTHIQKYAAMFKKDNASFSYDKFVEACVPPVIEVTAAGKRALLVGRNDPVRGIHHRMGGVQMTDTEFKQAQEDNDPIPANQT